MGVFHEMYIFDIASTKFDDFGSGTDKTRETNGCFMPRKTVLLHREEQEIGEIVFGVEPEIVEKEQFAILFDDRVEVAVAYVDENARRRLGLHRPIDK